MTRTPLWTSEHAAEATRGTNTRPWAATGVAIDSRTVVPGDLFIALAGPNRDAHDFVAAALARGAAAAVVHRVPPGIKADAPLLLVDDTMEALVDLGNAARARTGARIVAVTGSVGKTGVKEALAVVLGDQGATVASAKSYNNQWGVPLSLARMPADTRFGVFEVGMNHAGEIAPLSAMLKPHVALITTVEAVHLGHFPSISGIADAKAEVFEGMNASGVAALNHDNPFYHHLAQAARARGIRTIVSFGAHPDSTVRLAQSETAAETSTVKAAVGRRTLAYTLNVPGRHWVTNSLAVLAVAHALDVDLGRAATSLAKVVPLPGRGQRQRVFLGDGYATVIDESYNCSPVALKAALQVLAAAAPGPGGRRIAVLGDMLELGHDAPLLHAGFATCCKAKSVDLVFTVGPLMEHLRAGLADRMRGGHAATAEAILPVVLDEVRAGDVILVKGSRGIGLERVVAALIDLKPQPARCNG